jgi:hypothetical protein
MKTIFIFLILFISNIAIATEKESMLYLEFDDAECKEGFMSKQVGFAHFIELPPMDSKYFSIEPFYEEIDKQLGRECVFRNILLEGVIDEDALTQFKFALDVFNKRGVKNYRTGAGNLILNSPGGLIMTAMKIGDLVAENELGVDSLGFVDNYQCSSACIFIYAAGIFRDVGANLGIHRPFSHEISTKELSYKDYLKEYDALTPLMKSYLKKYGVSPSLVDAMNVVPSNEVRFLTYEERKSYGIGPQNIAFTEFQKAKTIQVCGKKYHDDYVSFFKIIDECEDSLESTIPYDRSNVEIANRSTEIKELCWGVAEKAFPNLMERAKECDEKKASHNKK